MTQKLSVDDLNWAADFPTEEEVKERKKIYYDEQRNEALKVIVPPAFQETNILRLPQPQVENALKWAVNPKSFALNLCLAGDTGVGKTRTAWEAIKRRFKKTGSRPTAIGAESFTRRLFREPSLMDQLCGIPLLLLDDLGKEKTTPTSESAIFELIRERMDNKLPTIYTTNFSPSKLAARFLQEETGQAVARRLKESSLSIVY